ncbi:OLC1v1005221C1 [Oldenlandia corymbosa var. corymbosa]|uniref:OLC1v1005221C1 n=1 Tax=Oldenlandia corymbosa var. corymbosa TaxID=529605 RepID=A0AAV1DG54_OLDCO|nr:OLC1v1005221C1 [Oldenlandia corymbosa var. corymbosa]
MLKGFTKHYHKEGQGSREVVVLYPEFNSIDESLDGESTLVVLFNLVDVPDDLRKRNSHSDGAKSSTSLFPWGKSKTASTSSSSNFNFSSLGKVRVHEPGGAGAGAAPSVLTKESFSRI